MTSDAETPKGTPLTLFTGALDGAERPQHDFPRILHNPSQFSRGLSFSSNFYTLLDPTSIPVHTTGLYTSSTANEQHRIPLHSPTLTDIGISPSSMVGNEQGHSVPDRNTEESSEHPAPQDVAQSPTQAGFLSHHAPSGNPPPNVYQGQHVHGLQTHHYQYPRGPGYPGPYGHHVDMGHSPPQQFVYHGYQHHAFSPPPQAQAQAYAYPVQASEDPSSRHGSYQTSQMYSQPPVSPGAGHDTHQAPFPGGVYPPPHYSPHSEYAYQHLGYHSTSPPLYPAQYGQASFQASVEPQHPGAWWYIAPGPPLPSPHLEGGRLYHPGFQRSYTYPSGPFIPAAADSRRSSTSAPVPSHASPPSPTSRAPPAQRGPPSSIPRTDSTTLEDGEETSGVAGRPLVRRSYHPRPPIQRSDWTMWAGNVPPDATSSELSGFFSQLPSVSQYDVMDTQPVVSVFLINRSNCAFINYDTEPHLNEAIEHFNGNSLRPNDSRCPKLLCRVRKKDDDLKTGVGAQRGTGMHTKWVKEQKVKKPASPVPGAGDAGSTSPPVRMMSSLSLPSSDEEHRRRKKLDHSSSSGSYASSTTSSFLARHFPTRYFILKSLTQHDLDLSVEKGLWATQKHNEGVLDQAFRTSQEVLLIFGVNKSGEFYGFARMASPIQSGEQQVAWEARKTSTPLSREEANTPATLPSGEEPPPLILSPSDHRLVTESPQAEISLARVNIGEYPISQDSSEGVFDTDAKHVQTAPAEVGQRNKFSVGLPPMRHTYEAPRQQKRTSESGVIRLDPEAPKRAIRQRETITEELAEGDEAKGDEQDEGYEDVEDQTWGQSFRVEWLSTERLPFYRIRHLRNPWNHEREVKVSRDGTELEPIVGQQLIDEWHALATAPADSGPMSPSPAGAKRASGKRSKAGT